jgi:hypothetical protein
VVLVSSGAGPRSGSEASLGMAGSSAGGSMSLCGWEAHPKRSRASNPNIKFRIISVLDGVILRKLPYEKITKG